MTSITDRYTHPAEPAGYHVHLPPLTIRRLETIAERTGEDYTCDEFGVYFERDSVRYSLLLHGVTNETLIVRSDYTEDFPHYASRKRIREEVDAWNQRVMWPNAYTHLCSGGHLHVYGDVAMDHSLGVTDNQVMLHISTVVGFAKQMYDEIIQAVR